MRRRAHVAWRGFSGPSPAVDISLEVMGSPPPRSRFASFSQRVWSGRVLVMIRGSAIFTSLR